MPNQIKVDKLSSGVIIGVLISLSLSGVLINTYNELISRPTPVPLTHLCIDRPSVLNEVTTLFLQEVMLVNPNDFDVADRYTHRPSGKNFSDEIRTKIQIHSIIFQAQKPGTGKYKKGRYDIHFDDQTCTILLTDLDW